MSRRAASVPARTPAVLRRAALPVAVLDALRFPRTARGVDEAVRLRADIARRGRDLADALHAMVGRLPAGSPLRPRIVGLRRALHAGRRPAGREWTPEVAGHLPAALAEAVSRWSVDLVAVGAAEEAVDGLLAAEHEQRRAVLVKAATDPSFRVALGGTSPTLAAELEKWIGQPHRIPRARTTLSVARYLARASAKTSPLSAFLTSGPVEWVPYGPALAVRPGAGRGAFELSYAHLREEIAHLVVGHPAVRDEAPLTLNPTAHVADEHVLYLPSAGSEALCAVPARPSVRGLFSLLGPEPHGLPRRELRNRLAGGDARLHEQVDTFLDHLFRNGLVVRALPVARIEDVPAAPADWLADRLAGRAAGEHAGATDEHAGAALAADLTALTEALSVRPSADDPVAYGDHRAGLVARVHGLTAHVGADDRRRAVFTSVAGLHVRDTVVSAEPLGTCSVAAWQPVLDDLDALRRWLAPWSPLLPVRLALTEILGDRVAARGAVPVLEVYREFQAALGADGEAGGELRRWLAPTMPSWRGESPFASVRRLGGVLRSAAGALAPFPLASGEPGVARTQVDVEPRVLREAAAAYPAWVPPLRSIGVLLQPTGEDAGGPRAVVNSVRTGFGSLRARIDHLAGVPGAGLIADEGSGPIYAGLRNRFGMSINDHRPRLPYEIVDVPYLPPGPGAPRRLAVGDLVVRHEEETGLLALWSVAHRRFVRVVHTGMGASAYLPMFAQLLTTLSGELPSHLPVPPVAGVRTVDTGDGRRDWPRLVAGRLTLRRSRIHLAAARVPVPQAHESDGRFLLRLAEWRRAEQLPRRVFFRVSRDDSGVEPLPPVGPAGAYWAGNKWHKPIYLDFDSWFLVQGLVAAVRRPGTTGISFDEALPDPLAPGTGPEHHVSELVLDVAGAD
ncbi:hypothetical protein F6X68_22405 [Micromonospora sp. AMSO12t]|uniref:hypothetical protein n=1 Tax=Micromonospora sp. AMSO12t TaxID=2650410 RepID=UPI00124AF12B|nr:hypothetical protein [Micromonospora sp. AMSO12t]KAB1140521.1 hypothetical protein F6X68_22405 [Micromonospora sp. AMSO12t]